MADNDFGIVVGISCYPALGDLDGPENDAQAFCSWLTSSRGGAVPRENVDLILSSDFGPPFASADMASPTTLQIERALKSRRLAAERSTADGERPRRLYLYFAGHGFSISTKHTALLTANADTITPYHEAGEWLADWFREAGYFDEVILFMDCCRDRNRDYTGIAPNMLWPPKITPGRYQEVKHFYAYATKWDRVTWEKKMDDGKVHGVFTTALLRGLKGHAVVPGDPSGSVTAESLKDYLYNNMHCLLTQAEMDDAQIPKEPQIQYEPQYASSLLLAQVPKPPKFPVLIYPSDGLIGKTIEILSDKTFTTINVIRVTNLEKPIKLKLARGTYLAQVQGTSDRRAVPVGGGSPVTQDCGEGEVHVKF
jgi:hypothetical protein